MSHGHSHGGEPCSGHHDDEDDEMEYDRDVSFDNNNSVLKETTEKGEGFDQPQDGTKIKVKVMEVLTASPDAADDFKNTLEAPKELEVVLGNGKLSDALEAACLEMKLNEEALLTCTIPADVVDEALGLSAGRSGVTKIRLKMMEFEKTKQKWDMTDEEKVAFAQERKDMGAALIKSGRTKLALQRYKGIVHFFDYTDGILDEELKKKAVELKKVSELNSAMVLLKLGDSRGAKESCTTVLKDDPKNVKALFRRATASKELKELAEAATDLKALLEEEPDNKAAKQLQLEVARMQKEIDKKQKNMYSNMCKAFGSLQPASAYIEPARPPGEEEGIKFLEENGKKEGVVTLASGLQYKVLTAGEGKFHPTKDSKCDCHYEGTLINGEKFDSSYDRGSTTAFAPSDVIKGWTEAMQLMVEGDKWEMTIPSDLAYGPNGSPPKIPGASTLIFTMEIVKIKGDTVPKKEAE